MNNEVQISLKNVNKSFGAHHVLNDVNIDINKGDFICIFGKSGGGKTTLLNMSEDSTFRHWGILRVLHRLSS